MTNAITIQSIIDHPELSDYLYIVEACQDQFSRLDASLRLGNRCVLYSTCNNTYADVLVGDEPVMDHLNSVSQECWGEDWPLDDGEYCAWVIDPVARTFEQAVGPSCGLNCNL